MSMIHMSLYWDHRRVSNKWPQELYLLPAIDAYISLFHHVSPDVQFGPTILFGSGGSLVEIYDDKSLALPPLNSNLAHLMMKETRIYKALKGVRGR